jgi:hypothetical protein
MAQDIIDIMVCVAYPTQVRLAIFHATAQFVELAGLGAVRLLVCGPKRLLSIDRWSSNTHEHLAMLPVCAMIAQACRCVGSGASRSGAAATRAAGQLRRVDGEAGGGRRGRRRALSEEAEASQRQGGPAIRGLPMRQMTHSTG